MKKTHSAICVAAFSYLLLAVLFTWPLGAKISARGFGIDEDAPYHIWHNWWLKFSLFNLHQNPLFTDYVFHPQKIPLVYDANAFVFGVLTLPLQFVTDNVVLSSNIVFLLSFAFSGMAMYFLVYFLLSPPSQSPPPAGRTNSFDGRRAASFLAGLIFAFSPYTLAQAIDGHINLTTTWLIPLYTLFLLKALRNSFSLRRAPDKSLKYAAIAGLLAAGQLYNDFTYTAFLALLTALVLFHFLFARRNQTAAITNVIKKVATIGAVAAIVGLPLLIPAYKLTQNGFRPGSPLWVQNEWAADFLAFFRPNDHSTFLKPLAYTPPRGTIEGTVYLGWTVIILAALATLRRFFSRIGGWKSETRNLDIGLWVLLAATFFVFSLGPFFHIGGRFQFSIFNFQFLVPLPWLLVHKIPLIGEIQEPARMNPFLLMPLSVLAAFGAERLADEVGRRWNKKTAAALLSGGLIGLVVFEYLPLPFPTTDLRTPEVYYQIGREPKKFAVLNLPLGFNSGQIALGPSPIGSLQFYQTAHQKPSFRATVARLPAQAFDYYRRLPLIKYLLNPVASPDSDDLNKELVQKTFKDQLHIKYIVLHKDKYRREGFPLGETEKLIETVLAGQKIYEKGGVSAFRLRWKPPKDLQQTDR